LDKGIQPNGAPILFEDTDIDVFIYGLTEEQANAKILQVMQTIQRNTGGKANFVVSQHSITLLGVYPYRHVQFILRLYRY
jgi:hypothetical protein